MKDISLEMLKLNKYGFYELKDKPNQQSLNEYYSKIYYQSNKGLYAKSYTDEEIEYFRNRLEEKFLVVSKFFKTKKPYSFLDIGCGEGWALDYFKNKGWQVTGIDTSNYGCKQFNPHCLKNLIVKDLSQGIEALNKKNEKFDLILMDNTLEHLLDPLNLLKQLKNIINNNGFLIIEVPNDFSPLQNYLLANHYVDSPYWIAIPDHISYFSKQGLKNLCKATQWRPFFFMSDCPIDINLLNKNTNYVKDKSLGKACHKARIAIENLLHSISPTKKNKLYFAMAELGFGREIIGFFRPQ